MSTEINSAQKANIISAFVKNASSCPSEGLMPYIPDWNDGCDATWDEGAEALGGWDKVTLMLSCINSSLNA